MLKSVSICAALVLAAAVFADSAEARQGFGGGRGMGGFCGARMGGWSGARMGGDFSGAREGARPWTLPVLGEWDSPVQAGSLVHGMGPLLGQAEVIGPALGGLAIGAEGIFAVEVFGLGA